MLKKFKGFLKWEGTPKPEYDIDTILYGELKPFRLPIILIILISVVGTIGYTVIDHMSLLDALYQTSITFTTVGFGEIAPISQLGRIFTINLIIFGYLVLVLSMGILIDVINKGTLMRTFKERSMLYRIARLKNHFVICYHNEYTIEVAKEFRKAQVPFVVIDPGENFEEEAIKYKYPYYINDIPYLDDSLRKAHTSSAKGVVILSKSISENITQISSLRLYERELNRQPYHIITSSENNNDAIKLKKLGANSVITPNKLMAQRISAMAIRPDMENLLETFLYQKDTPLDMEEVKIPEDSWMIFKKIKETRIRDLTQVSIIGIKEKNGKFIPMPKADTKILTNSTLLLIGTSNGIAQTKKIINKQKKPEELEYL